MANNDLDPKKNIVLEVAAIIGGMGGLFTVIELMIKDEVARVIGVIFLTAAALAFLIGRKLVNYVTAILIVFSVLTSLGLLFSFLSQPGTLNGYIYDNNGAPAAGLNMILTNANGIEQKSVTDKEGRFEIRNVPEGTFNIKANNQLIFTGNMPNGVQRLLTQGITIGTIIYTGNQNVTPAPVIAAPSTPTTPVPTTASPTVPPTVNTPTSIPTNLPTLTATFTPSQTPTNSLTVTTSAIPTVTANNQWKPTFMSFEGVEMALVPPGCFNMGSEDGGSDEKPMTKVCFDAPFYIDKTEVTQAQFNQFGGTAANKPAFLGDQNPVETITWFEARDYCTKRGARLPTEAEWEYAARGPESWDYPWGNTWDPAKLVWRGSINGLTARVGSIPAGASWTGALDMSGNVWEWTSSLYTPYPYNKYDGRENSDDNTNSRVLRGSSWDSYYISLLISAARNNYAPTIKFDNVGFRCARS